MFGLAGFKSHMRVSPGFVNKAKLAKNFVFRIVILIFPLVYLLFILTVCINKQTSQLVTRLTELETNYLIQISAMESKYPVIKNSVNFIRQTVTESSLNYPIQETPSSSELELS
jgi:predicted PurR-regulated permease PerM